MRRILCRGCGRPLAELCPSRFSMKTIKHVNKARLQSKLCVCVCVSQVLLMLGLKLFCPFFFFYGDRKQVPLKYIIHYNVKICFLVKVHFRVMLKLVCNYVCVIFASLLVHGRFCGITVIICTHFFSTVNS